MKRIPLLALVFTLLLAWSTPLPVDAASKYRPCSLLTAAELEGALRVKLSSSNEGDIIIPEGPFKGETMSSCTWVMGSTYVALAVMRGPRTPEQRAAGPAILRQAEEKLKKQGWTVESANIPGAACSTYKPPVGASGLASFAACYMESKGFGFSLTINGSSVTPQQVKALADKAAARLP